MRPRASWSHGGDLLCLNCKVREILDGGEARKALAPDNQHAMTIAVGQAARNCRISPCVGSSEDVRWHEHLEMSACGERVRGHEGHGGRISREAKAVTREEVIVRVCGDGEGASMRQLEAGVAASRVARRPSGPVGWHLGRTPVRRSRPSLAGCSPLLPIGSGRRIAAAQGQGLARAKLPPVTAVGEMPDLAGNVDPVRACHRNLLRGRFDGQE